MVKDKNRPRGKMSSYAYFVKVRRDDLKKKHPEQKVEFTGFSKECSEGWAGLQPDDKKTFQDMAKRDKDRYKEEMKSYVPPKGSRRKKKKDPNAPKRPASAFFVFIAEKRAKIKDDNPGISVGDTVKELGRLWQGQSPEDKAPYEEKAAGNRQKYNGLMITYKETKKSEMAERAAARAEKKSAPRRPVAKKVTKVMEVDDEEDMDEDGEEEDDNGEGEEEDEDEEREEEDDEEEL